jgi:hypothetical protein
MIPWMSATTLRIERRDGGLLVIEGAGLAEAILMSPLYIKRGHGFDALAGHTSRNSIRWEDVGAINQYMRARTSPDRWPQLVGPHPWLRRIDPELDLLKTSEKQWHAVGGEQLVRDALAGVIGEGRNVAVASKMLYLKRPRLFPILDRLIAQMLRAGFSPGAATEKTAPKAADVVIHLRQQGRANLPALLEIQRRVVPEVRRRLKQSGSEDTRGFDVSLVRILEMAVYAAHPAAGGSRMEHRTFRCRIG